jgi:hypothetical protein
MIFGVFSGILSWLAYWYSPAWLRSPSVLLGNEVKVSILPGVIFGSVVALLLVLFGARTRAAIVLAVVITTIGWVSAFEVSALSAIVLDQYKKASISSIERPATTNDDQPVFTPDTSESSFPSSQALPYIFAISGLPGGFLGGLSVVLSVALAISRFRRIETCSLTLLVATVSGVLLQFGQWHLDILLFVIWQFAVLRTVSYSLSTSSSNL